MQRMRFSLVVLAGLFGCPREAAPPEAAAPAGVAETKPPPNDGAATTETIAAPKPAAVAPAPLASPKTNDAIPKMVLVGELGFANDGTSLSLLQSSDRKAFAAVGPMLYVLEADGSLTHDDAWTRGIAGPDVSFDAASEGMFWWGAEAIGGSWPDGA
jgi:hypothetical protein